MATSDKELTKLCKKLLKETNKASTCRMKHYNPDCASCKFGTLSGLLEWLMDLLEDTPKKK